MRAPLIKYLHKCRPPRTKPRTPNPECSDKVTYGQSDMQRLQEGEGITFQMGSASMKGLQRKLTFQPPATVHYHGAAEDVSAGHFCCHHSIALCSPPSLIADA